MTTLNKCLLSIVTGFLFMAVAFHSAIAQNDYSTYEQMTQRLQNLESGHSDFAQLQSLAQTREGRDVWLLTLGAGDVMQHPAIAVIGGVKGSHIAGSELALEFAGRLLNSIPEDSLSNLLSEHTFYIVPRLNPDATEAYFAGTKYERDGNATPTDDDRDGSYDEDPHEDLNDDGWITLMRIEDSTGEWKTLDYDSRIVVKANADDGEKGSYKVYSEGTDNDNDGSFGEDGEGGVNINKNFTFDYPYFQPGAGENMLSQNENRGLLDFLFEKAWNTYAVVSFGPANNLSNPLSFSRGAVSQRVISGWYNEDIAVNKLVSSLYNETTGLKGAPRNGGQQGDLFQWAYFHYGRFSFSTPGWWVPPIKDSPNNDRAKFLQWADTQNLDAFVDWQEIDHPNYPDKTVEVGGIKPYMDLNPPYRMIDSLTQKHTHFLLELAGMHPAVKLVNFSNESAGQNLTRVSVDIYNSGTLPTASRLGERTDWVREVKAAIELGSGLNLVSGDKLEMIESIQGGGSVSMRWLIRGQGSYTIEAGAPQTGFSTIEHTIR